MNRFFVAIAALALLMTGTVANGFGGQPGSFGPNFPQIPGVNFPAAPQRPQLTFPGCSDIQSIGSPILLTYQAAQIVENAMKMQTQGSFVRFIYHDSAAGALPFSRIFTLIFEIRDQSGAQYVGIMLDNPTNGIGSVKFLKFIINQNIDIVKKVLKITAALPATAFVCGDLKMIFSSFGNDPRNPLPGQFPGQNNNSVSPALLKSLKELANTNTAVPPYRDCSISRFINQNNYFNTIEHTYPRNPDAENIAAFDQYVELSRCHPEGERIVERLTLTCDIKADNIGRLSNARVVFRIPFSSALETTPLVGLAVVASPPGVTSNIELGGAVKSLSLFYGDTVTWWAIRTYDENNAVLQTVICGGLITPAILDNPSLAPQKVNVKVNDFLGIFTGRKNGMPVTNAQTYFGFVKYE